MILVFHFHSLADQHQRLKLSLLRESFTVSGESVEKNRKTETGNRKTETGTFYIPCRPQGTSQLLVSAAPSMQVHHRQPIY